MNIIFVLGLIAIIIWIASLIVRRKNYKAGAIMSWTALIIIIVCIILHYTL
ncbi:MAG: hypothetical protein II937_16330 [Bacteroidales bacterium]|nr:hypothetical protein [Bacteroidales bacterium]